jgi:hypothetical protein
MEYGGQRSEVGNVVFLMEAYHKGPSFVKRKHRYLTKSASSLVSIFELSR